MSGNNNMYKTDFDEVCSFKNIKKIEDVQFFLVCVGRVDTTGEKQGIPVVLSLLL